MTFSLSVFVAMVLLLPGLAVFAALFGSGRNVFRAAPPAPASFTALTIVIAGACIAHMAGFVVAALLRATGRALDLVFAPSPYAVLIELAGRRATSEPAILSFLILTLVLSIGAGMLAYLVVRHASSRSDQARRGRLALFFYGWLAKTVVLAEPANRYVNAYVLCDLEVDGGWIGYEGTLEALSLSSDKEILSVLLLDARTFRLDMKDGARGRSLFGTPPIERLQIAAARIVNIAFEIYELPPEGTGRG